MADSRLGLAPNMVARPNNLGSGVFVRPKVFRFGTHLPDPNKQRIIVHFSCQKREKKEKKHKQLIIDGNPTMICLHTPHHMKEDTSTHLSRRRMARFSHQEESHAPL
jgi:hypothetical protein